MHTLILMGLLLTHPVSNNSARTEPSHRKEVHRPTWQNQLNDLIRYPTVLKPNVWGTTVTLRFQLDGRQRITAVEVFSPNESLNRELIGQLTGRRLAGLPVSPGEFQVGKVHFL